MMSKPATQIVTAAKSNSAGTVTRPATPIYAPSGARPSTAPSTKCVVHVKRLQSGYARRRSAAIGISFTQSGLSIHAAQSRSRSPAALAQSIVAAESAPDATARRAVRGLRASISRSKNRFVAIAAVRAPKTASVIHASSAGAGIPCAARTAPTYANGNAKSVCSMRISRKKRTTYFNAGP